MSDSDRTLGPQGSDTDVDSLFGDELSPGATAGELVVEGTIASGGCGTVYTARHRILGRRVALKVLHRSIATSPEMVARFVQEARAVNLIRHPGIVDIFDFGHLPDRRPYYVMELLEGSDLRALIGQQGRFSPIEALEILEPVGAALEAAHAAGFVHRDLKASNIVVEVRAGRRVIKLLDFGIAKLVEPEGQGGGVSSAASRVGSPHSMAPEQIRGHRVDRRTDVYAMGVLLYQLLTGSYPFDAGDPVEVERLHLEAPPPRASTVAAVPVAMDDLIARGMAKLPDQRFPTVLALIEALRAVVHGGEVPRRDSQPGAGVPALGIYLDVATIGSGADDADDATFEAMTTLLDQAAEALGGAGYSLPLRSTSSILAVLALPDLEPAAELAARRQALDLAITLHTRLGGQDGGLEVRMVVHADRGTLRAGARGLEIGGGPILKIGAWVPRTRVPRVVATAAALGGLGPTSITQV